MNSPIYGRTGHGNGAIELAEGCSSVLDIGAGYTDYAAAVRDQFHMERAVVTDISSAPYYEQSSRGVTFIESSIPPLPFEEDEFELVTAFDVLEHIPSDDLDDAIWEMFRVASRRVIVSVGVGSSKHEVDGENVELHETIKPLDWWMAKLTLFAPVRIRKMKHRLYASPAEIFTPYLVCEL